MTVAALGGSASSGSSFRVLHGAGWLYHTKVFDALSAVFETSHRTMHTHRNGAMPATGPLWVEHCVDDLLGSATGPDLLLLEFGLNLDGQPAAFERLLRKLLASRPTTAIVVVNIRQWVASDVPGPSCDVWRQQHCAADLPVVWRQTNDADAAAIAALCVHYRVPLVSMGAGVRQAVRAAEMSLRAHISRDGRHPSDMRMRMRMRMHLHLYMHMHRYTHQPRRPPPERRGPHDASPVGATPHPALAQCLARRS